MSKTRDLLRLQRRRAGARGSGGGDGARAGGGRQSVFGARRSAARARALIEDARETDRARRSARARRTSCSHRARRKRCIWRSTSAGAASLIVSAVEHRRACIEHADAARSSADARSRRSVPTASIDLAALAALLARGAEAGAGRGATREQRNRRDPADRRGRRAVPRTWRAAAGRRRAGVRAHPRAASPISTRLISSSPATRSAARRARARWCLAPARRSRRRASAAARSAGAGRARRTAPAIAGFGVAVGMGAARSGRAKRCASRALRDRFEADLPRDAGVVFGARTRRALPNTVQLRAARAWPPKPR